MAKEITVSLPENTYHQVELVAQARDSSISDVLVSTITDIFAPFPVDPKRAEMKKEVAAYRNLHPELVKQYLGQYVAIYRGELVDHDADPVALHYRVVADYPGEIVLSRKVEPKAETVLHMRSPRLEILP